MLICGSRVSQYDKLASLLPPVALEKLGFPYTTKKVRFVNTSHQRSIHYCQFRAVDYFGN